MKARGIEGIQPRRFRKTTDSAHDLPIADNLLARKFDVAEIRQPNRVWAGDITYLQRRARAGFILPLLLILPRVSLSDGR